MNNPELIHALCDQIITESEGMKRTTCNARNAITNDTRDMFSEMQLGYVVNLQKLVMALTEEMTPEQKHEFEEQVQDNVETGGE